MSTGFQHAVTEFVFVRDCPQKSDIIMVPGSADQAHVLKAAQLYREGYAPRILPSGLYAIGSECFSISDYPSEWAWMRAVLMEQGVPEHAILREDHAQYTWENAQFSRQVTDQRGLEIRQAILCCRPFHARRALFYYQTAFPETQFYVCPSREPGLDRDDWYLTACGRETVLGEVRRLGDQIRDVWEAAIEKTGQTKAGDLGGGA